MDQSRHTVEDRLQAVAQQAQPPSFTASDVISRVKRRRRLIGWGGAAMTAVVLLGVAVLVRQGGLGAGPVPRPGGSDAGQSESPGGSRGVYMCGQPLQAGNALPSRNGLSLQVSSVRRVSVDAGPAIEVTLSGDQPVELVSTPPQYIEVLYLHDGIIVGGGPMLNAAGDNTPQGTDMIGYPVRVAPGSPSVQRLGARDRLCAPLRWSQVWAAPGRYEVVVLLYQPVDVATGPVTSDVQLLVARAPLRD